MDSVDERSSQTLLEAAGFGLASYRRATPATHPPSRRVLQHLLAVRAVHREPADRRLAPDVEVVEDSVRLALHIAERISLDQGPKMDATLDRHRMTPSLF